MRHGFFKENRLIWAIPFLVFVLVVLNYQRPRVKPKEKPKQAQPTSSGVVWPEPFSLSSPSADERYVTYLPHSGFHNQRIALENALLLAHYLNRTLLLPPVYLTSPAFPWLRFDKMYERLLLQTKNGLEYCSQLRENEPLPAECVQHPHWTWVPWTFFYDLQPLLPKIRIVFRNDMSLEWIQDSCGQDIYFLKDLTPFDYRIYDLPSSQTPLQRFMHRIELEALEAVEERVIHLGSLFGSYRVLAQTVPHQALLQWIRSHMIFKNPVLLEVAGKVVERLGGVRSFVGLHLRVGDGVFKARAGLHVDALFHQLVNDYTDLTLEELSERYDPTHHQDRQEDTHYEIKQLRDTAPHQDTHLPLAVSHPPPSVLQPRLGAASTHLTCGPTDGRNDRFAKTTLYIATDCPHPREHPLLQKLFKTFPCIFVLDDFLDSLAPLQQIHVAQDNVPLQSYLIPMVDAIISAQGHTFYGTNASTFSTYIQRQLHPVYTDQPIPLADVPLP
ncbi:CigA protein [Sporodiniella umbellata]|nr:CigA protein [Sporodiniella umbellata]